MGYPRDDEKHGIQNTRAVFTSATTRTAILPSPGVGKTLHLRTLFVSTQSTQDALFESSNPDASFTPQGPEVLFGQGGGAFPGDVQISLPPNAGLALTLAQGVKTTVYVEYYVKP